MPSRAKTVKGIDGAAVTMLKLDKTHTLETLIAAVPDQDPLQLLGELQFAFVTFVLGENFESF